MQVSNEAADKVDVVDPKNIEELYVQIADTCYAVEEAASEENLKAIEVQILKVNHT